MRSLQDHRVRVHVGPPTRGRCRAERFRYVRGDVDLMPAGVSDTWFQEETGASLVVKFPPLLLRRTAIDLGVDPDLAALEAGFAHQSHMARWLRRVFGALSRAMRSREAWEGEIPLND